ncbi:hypothetical protein NQ318_013631, partial [Aromia moschata]
MDIHQKQLKGQSQSQVENTFLKLACQLDTYGVDPHPVKDHKGTQLYLGINYSGILTFQGSRKTHHFRWPDIQKINYEGKMFIIHLNYNDKKHTVGFKCPSGAACRHVWRCAIEQMLFFTLPTSSDAPSVVTGGGFFSWGTKFKYTGRTEREILEDTGSPSREEPNIQRSSSVRRKASSVPATPSTPLQPHLVVYPDLVTLMSGDLEWNPAVARAAFGVGQQRIAGLHRRGRPRDCMRRSRGDRGTTQWTDSATTISRLVRALILGIATDRQQLPRCTTPRTHPTDPVAVRRLCLTPRWMVVFVYRARRIRYRATRRRVKNSTWSGHYVPTLVVVTVVVLIATVIMLETDCEVFGSFRNMPEMVSLRYQVYEPLKQYFRNK